MNKIILLLLVVAMVGCAFGRPQFGGQTPFRPGGNFQFGANRPPPSAFPGQNIFNTGSGQVVGTGTGIANPSAGGVGIGLGVGAAVASPVGNFAIGQGESFSTGK
ncbi:hypothetical protein DAPPUDRAFT_321122 [Daphnia pulex]|uniref:Uncharacterized protein n=1 Tax=Daphnia pulex TaxID=6669 RepID=E9GRZ7_DAPPU|nr:hypothetical protein DAPPUDRAFT_321122 [Daphnia pulex]|eukprot:EFX77750.1 hypothetical protein DAPPUDRAFT_321122 [Daphnia pulex]